jgi:hypothetical protein
MRLILGLALLIFGTTAAVAVRPDECEQQRAQYPKNWSDVSHEQALFDCSSHYSGGIRVKIGASDSRGRTLFSLVPLTQGGTAPVEDTSKIIYRIWLDKEQLKRLKDGKYFATILRKEESCWIRGDLDKDEVFFMDNADPPSDGPDAGSFYNKAPRLSVFQGDAYDCKAVK